MTVWHLVVGLLVVWSLGACAPLPIPQPIPEPTSSPLRINVFPTLTPLPPPTHVATLPPAPKVLPVAPTPTFVWSVALETGYAIHLPLVNNPVVSEPALALVLSTTPIPAPTTTPIPPISPTPLPPTELPTNTPEPTPTQLLRPTAPPPPRAATQPPSLPPLELRADLPAMTLNDWERPIGDNGRCMHWSRNQYFTQEYVNTNLPRLQQLNAKWVVVVYADENIITMAAPRFKEAGIIPIWRKMLRPFERYYSWSRDVALVKSFGLPPYFQIYNEPSLGQEWVDEWDEDIDEALFLDNLMHASQEVYNAGGYVGWQFVNQTWLDHAIDEVERRGSTQIFERFFFIPHSYGDNIPPEWTEDGRGVLGWRNFADQLHRRLGFVPPLIVGEGGWRINSHDEPRFPPMDEAIHAQYHVELFDWFRTGVLSNDEALPNYLLAYCPWLISEKGDDNAWWDSFAGDRLQTIEAVGAMPPFERQILP